MIDLRQKLSPHFTLREMVVTSHRSIDNTPSPAVIEQMRVLCNGYLELVRDRFGPLWVTSGFRCIELNIAIGGSATSAHMAGNAADFVPIRPTPTIEIVRWVVDHSGLDYDQIIDEYSSTSNWIHLGRRGGRPRHQALTMRGGRYYSFSDSENSAR